MFQEKQVEGDPELVEDAEFYQQLLKEFFETIDPASSGIIVFCFFLKEEPAIRLLNYQNLDIGGRGGFLRNEEVSNKEEESCGSACLQEPKDQVTYLLWFGFSLSVYLF